MSLTKAQREAKEKAARAASMFNSMDPVVAAEIELGRELSEEERERITQAAEHAKRLGPT